VPQADTVYVTPPNCNLVMHEDGSLHLLEPPNETVPKPSVNLFFSSLADVVTDRAIGVVLSGTGSDGAIGLHAIKAAGGFSFAQEPGGAKYDGMIRAAIEAGGVDWVLPAESIGAEIGRVVQRQQAAEGHATHVDQMPPATLQVLLHSLYAQTRIDFTGYKEATLLRRIERRMTSTGCLTLDQYVELARANPQEMQALSQDMLISVTSFFRDRVAFDRLREEVVRMLEGKPAGEDVRVWVAGCASGEEAYSIAIILHDALLGHRPARRVQIFASDIDELALARARRAVYPVSLLGELDPSTLERHFVRHADGYEVSKTLRGLVMFARHNLVQDPPFVRLDLVSCRNVLIYLQAALQERLVKTFHYALEPRRMPVSWTLGEHPQQRGLLRVPGPQCTPVSPGERRAARAGGEPGPRRAFPPGPGQAGEPGRRGAACGGDAFCAGHRAGGCRRRCAPPQGRPAGPDAAARRPPRDAADDAAAARVAARAGTPDPAGA
jgi:two-component system CheB/CheR fusion protein